MQKSNVKNILIGVTICLIIFVAWLPLILTAVNASNAISAEKIYQNNLHTVVEVKSFTTEDAVMYGSAVCVGRGGLFITNAHIVSYEEYTETKLFEHVQIRFFDSDEYVDAVLEKIDYDKDLALIKVESCSSVATSAKIRTKKLAEGETVYAIGNAQNYGIAIAQGIVAQKEINIEIDGKNITAIQCSLNITEGNSGGALLDANGQLIGITTFRLKDKVGNVVHGISFAIPISIVQDFLS